MQKSYPPDESTSSNGAMDQTQSFDKVGSMCRFIMLYRVLNNLYLNPIGPFGLSFFCITMRQITMVLRIDQHEAVARGHPWLGSGPESSSNQRLLGLR